MNQAQRKFEEKLEAFRVCFIGMVCIFMIVVIMEVAGHVDKLNHPVTFSETHVELSAVDYKALRGE